MAQRFAHLGRAAMRRESAGRGRLRRHGAAGAQAGTVAGEQQPGGICAADSDGGAGATIWRQNSAAPLPQKRSSVMEQSLRTASFQLLPPNAPPAVPASKTPRAHLQA